MHSAHPCTWRGLRLAEKETWLFLAGQQDSTRRKGTAHTLSGKRVRCAIPCVVAACRPECRRVCRNDVKPLRGPGGPKRFNNAWDKTTI